MNWRRGGFVAVEVALLLAIPFVATAGFRAVLEHDRGPGRRPGARSARARLRGVRRADADRAPASAPTAPPAVGRGRSPSVARRAGRCAALRAGGDADRRRREAGHATLAEVYADDGLTGGRRRRPPRCSAPGSARSSPSSPTAWRRCVGPSAPLARRQSRRARRASTPANSPSTAPRSSATSRPPTTGELRSGPARPPRGCSGGPGSTAVAASSDPDVVPGEAAAGVGRFVRGLAAGPRDGRGDAGGGGRPTAPSSSIPAAVDRPRRGPRAVPGGGLARAPGRGSGCSTPSVPPGCRSRSAREAVRAGGPGHRASATPTGSAPSTSAIVYFDPALTPAAEAAGRAHSASGRRSSAPGRTPTTSSISPSSSVRTSPTPTVWRPQWARRSRGRSWLTSTGPRAPGGRSRRPGPPTTRRASRPSSWPSATSSPSPSTS